MQKLLTFFSKNISVYAVFNDHSFNDTLTNGIVSFEQLDHDLESKWTGIEHFLEVCMCIPGGLRPTGTSAQADQSVRCSPEEVLDPWLLTDYHVKTLIRLRGCYVPA